MQFFVSVFFGLDSGAVLSQIKRISKSVFIIAVNQILGAFNWTKNFEIFKTETNHGTSSLRTVD